MKFFLITCVLSIPFLAGADAPYDRAEIRDQGTLETRVIRDWQPNAKDPDIDQKLIEITVCEWWPGQKVRLPVTLNIPAGTTETENVIVANSPLALKAATPRGVELEMLKTHGVRYTPAWIWGIGQMRALTAAEAESESDFRRKMQNRPREHTGQKALRSRRGLQRCGLFFSHHPKPYVANVCSDAGPLSRHHASSFPCFTSAIPA